VAVAHELAGLGARRAPAGAVGDVVEAQLEELQQVRAGDAGAAVGLFVEVAELLLQQP
jgi:predicted transcriptional regulator